MTGGYMTGGPDWEDVRAFLAVADGSSLPEAARRLGVSAATVGRRVQRLERRLGAALLVRGANRVGVAPAGTELVAWAREMERAAGALARRAAGLGAPDDAPVRVTATGSLSLFLARHAVRLRALAGVAVSVLATRAVVDVASGEADLALRMRRLPEDGPLAARRLGRVAFSVYAARGVAPAGEDWRGMAVVGLEESERAGSQSAWLDAAARARGAAVGLRFGDTAVRLAAVQAGAGASLLPCFLGDAEDGLVRLLPPPEVLAQDVYLLLPERGRVAARVRAVADAVGVLVAEEAGALGGGG